MIDKNELIKPAIQLGIAAEFGKREGLIMFNKLRCILVTLGFLMGVNVAGAAVITFDNTLTNPYFEDGYKLTGTAGFLCCIGSGLNAPSATPGSVTMVSQTGSAFDINSMQVSGINGAIPSQALVFTGIFAGGGSIVQNFNTIAGDAISTILFPGFNGLSSFTFTHRFTGFDNINVETAVVPLPAALPLLAGGLGLMGLLGWRRKRTDAAAV